MAKVFVATPMYGGVCHGQFLKSINALLLKGRDKGHEITFTDLYNESLINRARNTLTELFLRTNSEYLLFIDADQGFDADAVLRMINENLDIVGAAVPMKGINWQRVEKAVKDGKTDLAKQTGIYNVNMSQQQKDIFLKNPNSVAEIEYIGTGLMLIKRDVLEILKEHVGAYRSDQLEVGTIKKGDTVYDFWKTVVDPKSERLLSEDYNFCKLWKDQGGKIYLAPYVKVVHAGTYWFQ